MWFPASSFNPEIYFLREQRDNESIKVDISAGPCNSDIFLTLLHPSSKLTSVHSLSTASFGANRSFPVSMFLVYQQVSYLVHDRLMSESSSSCSYSSPDPLQVQQGQLSTAFPLQLCIMSPKECFMQGIQVSWESKFTSLISQGSLAIRYFANRSICPFMIDKIVFGLETPSEWTSLWSGSCFQTKLLFSIRYCWSCVIKTRKSGEKGSSNRERNGSRGKKCIWNRRAHSSKYSFLLILYPLKGHYKARKT